MTHRTKVILGTTVIILFLVGFISGVIFLSSRFYKNEDKKTDAANNVCASGQHINHIVNIKDGKAVPDTTVAPLCDTLTIINTDDRVRLMAFGLHEEHEPYDGISEKSLAKDESLTVTLIQAGDFRFHDHIGDEAEGTFTVTAQ